MKKLVLYLAIVVMLALVGGTVDAKLTDGLVAYYDFDTNAGSVLPDIHAGTHNGTITSYVALNTTNKKLGTASYTFYGAAADYTPRIEYAAPLEIQVHSTVPIATQCGWLYYYLKDPPYSNEALFLQSYQNTGAYGVGTCPYGSFSGKCGLDIIWAMPSDTVYLVSEYSNDGSGQRFEALGAENDFKEPHPKTWEFWCWIINSTGIFEYVNGSSYVNNSRTDTIIPSGRVTTGGGKGAPYPLWAEVDEVGYWNRTLTNAEISQLWASGNGLPYAQFNPPPPTVVMNFTTNYTLLGVPLPTISALVNGSYLANETRCDLIVNTTGLTCTQILLQAGNSTNTTICTPTLITEKWIGVYANCTEDIQSQTYGFLLDTSSNPSIALNITTGYFTEVNESFDVLISGTNWIEGFNCSLFLNDTGVACTDVYGSVSNVSTCINSVSGERSFTAYATCDGALYHVNSTIYPFWIDNIAPVLIASTITNNSYVSNTLRGNFTWIDSNLYRLNVSIDGTNIFNVTSINTTSYTYQLTYDVHGLSVGTDHTLRLEMWDAHTANELKDAYTIGIDKTKSKISYSSKTNAVAIEAIGEKEKDTLSTTRQTDRYTFTYTPTEIKEEYTFLVTTSIDAVIVDYPNTKWKRWIVSGTKWIDFYLEDEPGADVTYTKIKDGEIQVKVRGLKKPLEQRYNSIGELNVLYTTYNFSIGTNLNFTGVNLYNGSSMENFTATVVGNNVSLTGTTTSGKVNFENLPVGTYLAQFTSPHFLPMNYTVTMSTKDNRYNYTSYEAMATIVIINSLDLVQLSNGTLAIYDASSTVVYNISSTNISTMLGFNVGNYTYTFTKVGYFPLSGNFSLTYLDNKTVTGGIIVLGTFNLFDERTLAPFNVSAANRVTFQLFCPTETFITELNTSSFAANIACNYTRFRFVIEYPTVNYYRTFIFAPADLLNVNIFLIDFTTTQSVQVNFVLDDLFQEYQNPSVFVYKLIQAANNTQIHADYADIENKVTAFLIQYDEYMVEVHSDNRPDYALGRFIATASGDKILTLYRIGTDYSVTSFGSGVTYAMWLDNYTGTPFASVYYQDVLNGTNLVTWEVHQGTPTGALLTTVTTTSVNFTSMFNLSPYLPSNTYGTLIIDHRDGSIHTIGVEYTTTALIPVLEFIADIGPEVWEWGIMILIGIIALYGTISTGTPLAFLIAVVGIAFVRYGWLGYTTVIGQTTKLGAVLAAIILFIVIYWFREEERAH